VNITDRAATGQIIEATTSTGAKPIPAIADAHARAVRLSAAVRNLGSRRDDLAVAVAAALDRGDDPGSDPEVQAILVRQQIDNEGVAQAVDAIAFETFREVCHEHADQLVQSWRVPFDQAAGVLFSAHAAIGDLPLDDHAGWLAKGKDVASTWGNARAADATIDRIVLGWSALGEFTRLVSRDRRWNVLRLGAVGPVTFGALNDKATAWEAILAGVVLSLPTFDQFHDRVRVIQEAAARAQADAEQAAHDWATGRQRQAVIG